MQRTLAAGALVTGSKPCVLPAPPVRPLVAAHKFVRRRVAPAREWHGHRKEQLVDHARGSRLTASVAAGSYMGHSGRDDWRPDNKPSLLQEQLSALVLRWLQPVWTLAEAVRRIGRSAVARALLLLVGATLACRALLTLVAVPLVNAQVLPGVSQAAERVLLREVRLGGLQEVSLSGLLGLQPLVVARDIYVGAGPVERSSIKVEAVELRLLPLVSLAQQQVVLALRLRGLAADLVQCANMSWLGYPTDTVPSPRDFMPGLQPTLEQPQEVLAAQQQQQQDEEAAIGAPERAAQQSVDQHTKQVTSSGPSQYSRLTAGAAADVEELVARPARSHVAWPLLQQVQQVANSVGQAVLARALDTVQHPLQSAAGALVSQLHLGRVSVEAGSAVVHIAGEVLPRHVTQFELVAVLGPGYRTLDLALEADAAPRHPGSSKITLINPAARRHLRHVTPGCAPHPQDRLYTGDVGPRPWLLPAAVQQEQEGPPPPMAQEAAAHGAAPEDAGSAGDLNAGHQPGSGAPLQHQAESSSTEAGDIVNATTSSPAVDAAAPAAQVLPPGPVCMRLGGGQVPATIHYQAPTSPGLAELPDSSSTSLACAGGHFSVRLTNAWPAKEGQHGVLNVRVRGTRVHAPLLERLLEIPMDISAGEVVEGELRVVADDAASWDFPRVYGKLVVRDASFHIWDASDDILGCDMDLVFDNDRLYLHNATAHYGAIPLCVSGDMDLNAGRGGQYRLQASVPGVEINAARASLGINPIPFPVAGAVRGVLHATGPLEHPIFSGSISAVRPSATMLEGSEDTVALRALLGTPAAVVAYDRLPASAATAVFTLDTSTEMLVVHSGQAVPLGGGLVGATAKVWVAPAAEADPRALAMDVVGQGLDAGQLAAAYLSQGAGPAPPIPALSGSGPLNLRCRLEGSHLAPTTMVNWAAPVAGANGSATFTTSAIQVTSGSADQWRMTAALDITNPGADKARAAVTQAEATYWGTPRVEAFQLDASLAALDMLPLLAPTPAPPAPSSVPGRMSSSSTSNSGGSGSGSGGMLPAGAAPKRLRASGQLVARGTRDTSLAARRQQAVLTSPDSGFLFTGSLQLQGLQLNNCRLCRRLGGDLVLTPVRVLLRTMGSSAREALSADLALPDGLLQQPVQPDGDGNIRPIVYHAPQAGAARDSSSTGSLVDGSNEAWGGSQGTEASQEVSNLLLRRDDLYFSSTVNAAGSVCGGVVENLLLDELELGTLRGKLCAAQFDLDLGARHGRGALLLEGPRLLGLRGKRLEAAARWEQEVVVLERCVLAQQASTYELSGEYVLPPGMPLPSTLLPEAAMSGAPDSAPPEDSIEGRWRLQVNVPSASVEELLPMGAALQAATQATAADTGAAKGSFLTALHRLASAASPEDFRPHVAALLEAASAGSSGGQGTGPAPQGPGGTSMAGAGAGEAVSSTGAAARLPGLHELRGGWSGSLTAVGGAGLEPRCDLHLEGDAWVWGPYRMDQALVTGTASASEGLVLERLLVVLGGARVEAAGALLGPQQDAVLVVSDFPAVLLQPIYSALPALQHAAPAAGAGGGRKPRSGWPLSVGDFLPSGSGPGSSGSGSSGSPLGGVAGQVESALVALGVLSPSSRQVDPWEPFLGSPVSGLINVNAKLGGSMAAPSGTLQVSLVQGALGATRLATATAKARLEGGRSLTLTLDAAPAAHKGKLHMSGSLELPQSAAAAAAALSQQPSVAGGKRKAKQQVSKQAVEARGAVDVALQVEDGGMALMAGLVPGLSWEGGGAGIQVTCQGPLDAPAVAGTATLHRASIACNWLRHPITAANCSLAVSDQQLTVSNLEARVGPRGTVKAAGALPLTAAAAARQQQPPAGLTLSCSDVELRVRNMYSGLLSAAVSVSGTAEAPEVGGRVGLSKGTIFLLPAGGGAQGAGPEGAAVAAQAAQAAAAATTGTARPVSEVSDADLVAQAFAALKAGGVRRAVAAAAASMQQLPVQVSPLLEPGLPSMAASAPGAPPLRLSGLVVELGPELRAVFPVVLNVGLSGSLAISGCPAAPAGVGLQGVLRLEGGSLNLVATQFRLDREVPATITFTPEGGADPLLDLALVSAELRATLAGRASAWKEHLTLSVIAPAPSAAQGSSSSSAGQPGGEGSAAWQMAEVARLWEGRLADSLLRGGAGLSLTTLASNTVSSLLPKLETQGQLGGARWRLVSAPSLPGLLSTDSLGRSGGPQLLRSLVLGTEVELSLGQRLVAALSHSASTRGEAADAGTEVRLALALSRQLRLLMQLRGMNLAPTVFLQYSSDQF